MRRTKILGAVLLLLAFVFPAPQARAASAACFCNVAKVGATAYSGASDGPSCQKVCAKVKDAQGYLWATDPSQYPGSLLQCYADKSFCEVDFDHDGKKDGELDSKQPAECLPGSHYCYPATSIPYTLQISIPSKDGPITTINNFGDYIGTMYKYLLGLSMTVAVVFVMIGGIRYVIGASTGEIGKAKEMIGKAVAGFVLLMFAYVILYTVNPNLLKLQPPSLPMIRRVVLLDGKNSCESLKAIGYTLDEAGAAEAKGRYGIGYCGSTVKVLSGTNGATVPEGTTCQFSSCGDGQFVEPGSASDKATAQCVSNGKDAYCLSCGQVYATNDFLVAPSPEICSKLDPPDDYANLVETNPEVNVYDFCGYTQEPSMFSDGLAAAGATTATVAAAIASGGALAGVVGGLYTASVLKDAATGSCVALTIQCGQIQRCSDYNSPAWQVSNSMTDNELFDLDWNSLGDPNIVDVCREDPCGAGRKSEKTCAYNEKEGDCRAADYDPSASTSSVERGPKY